MSQATETELPELTTDVLTLPEAASYLRVSEADVIEMVTHHDLPARKIGDQWRFLKRGLENWLVEPSGKNGLLQHAGAMKDDPEMENILKKIYQERGRSMTEDGE